MVKEGGFFGCKLPSSVRTHRGRHAIASLLREGDHRRWWKEFLRSKLIFLATDSFPLCEHIKGDTAGAQHFCAQITDFLQKCLLRAFRIVKTIFCAAFSYCANIVQPTRFRARIYSSLAKARLKNPTSSFRKRKTAVLGCFSICSLTN